MTTLASNHLSGSTAGFGVSRSRPFLAFGISRRLHHACTTGTRAPRTRAQASTEQQVTVDQQPIGGLDRNYCNDFECTSSPAVETTVRAFARDIQRLRYTLSLFNPDASYTDGFRSFTGKDKFERQRWYSENIKKPQVTITSMRMLDKGTAELQWRVTGDAGGPANISVTSVIEMNLLTGRITKHKESWDLSKLSPPAAALLSLSRTLWSLKQASQDTQEGVSKKVSESLSSMDEDSNNATNFNPTDPTRFFQQNNQDNQFQDYVSYGFIVALLYLAYQAFAVLDKM